MTMPRLRRSESLRLWQQYGEHVLMAAPYDDALIVEAKGCTFTDADGNEYLDMAAGQICSIVGHSHPALMGRLIEQLQKAAHTSTAFLSPVALEACARLAGIAPGPLDKVLLLSTGAEANEFALRLAKTATGKTGALALTKGYAGLTLATGSLTNYGKSARPIVPGTGYLLTPDPTACPRGRAPLEWARELLAQSLEINRGLLDNVAAIVVEPILSAGGLIVLPDGFLKELRRLANDLGALLIADEAQTGMGRTGKWFGVDHESVVPDILVASKGIGGGFPLSAVVTTSEVADRALGRAGQFSSHQCDPLGAAAGLAVIDIIESENLISRADDMGRYMRDELHALANYRPQLAHVRGRGLMVGFDVFRDPEHGAVDADAAQAVEDYCRARGVYLQRIQKNRFRVLPPLVIQRQEVDRFVSTLSDALTALAAGSARPETPQNPYSAAFHKRPGRVASAMRWAWTHSPEALIDRIRGVLG